MRVVWTADICFRGNNNWYGLYLKSTRPPGTGSIQEVVIAHCLQTGG